MTIKTRLLLGVGVLAGTVGILFATPIVGLNFATILSAGVTRTDVNARARVVLPLVPGQENEDNQWNAKLVTSGPSIFTVQDVSYLPNGHTGWHSHPGVLLVSVTEGSIEWYDQNCVRAVYKVGDSFTETTALHYVRNVSSINARFMVTYVLAPGLARRIDQPAPACAAALGLD